MIPQRQPRLLAALTSKRWRPTLLIGVVALAILSLRYIFQAGEARFWTESASYVYTPTLLGWELSSETQPWLGADLILLTALLIFIHAVTTSALRRVGQPALRFLTGLTRATSTLAASAVLLFAFTFLASGLPNANTRAEPTTIASSPEAEPAIIAPASIAPSLMALPSPPAALSAPTSTTTTLTPLESDPCAPSTQDPQSDTMPADIDSQHIPFPGC